LGTRLQLRRRRCYGWELLSVTSSRWEKSLLQGSGFPLISRHKHALIRHLERERKRLEEAERLGPVIKWSRESGYVALHDPTTGEWHDVPVSGCLPSVVESAKAHRQRRGQRR
jgi:hypothetical protein